MTKDELLSGLPAKFHDDLTPEIHTLLIESKKTIIVLDDDPSGTNTVFDVPVLTDLSPDTIKDAIDEAPPVLFLLTHSKSLGTEQTTALHKNLGETLKEFEDDIIVISRSDSSLPGKFPIETNTLREALDIPKAPTLFIPCLEADEPLTKSDFQSLSLVDIRSGDITTKLADLPDGSTCFVDASSLSDLNVLSLALLKSARRFIIRSAASFVQSLAGIPSRPPLEPWQLQDLYPNPNGGLIIVGSHVPTTTDQLNHLLKNSPNLTGIKLSVPDIINSTFNLKSTITDAQTALTSGQNVVLFTSRKRIDGDDDPTTSKAVSKTLVEIVRGIKDRPSFLVTKGGSTSSDIATEALGVRQAQVLGQILPGVPVWTIGNEILHPGLAYVIFPGNVGDEDALTLAVEKLTP